MDWAPAVMEPWTFHLRWCWKLLWGRERFPIGQLLLVMGHCSSWGQSPNSHVCVLARHLICNRWIKEGKCAKFILVQLCHAQTKSNFNGNFFSACSCFVVNRCQTWCLLSLGLAMRQLCVRQQQGTCLNSEYCFPWQSETESLLIPTDVVFRKTLYSSKDVDSGWIRGVCIHICVCEQGNVSGSVYVVECLQSEGLVSDSIPFLRQDGTHPTSDQTWQDYFPPGSDKAF